MNAACKKPRRLACATVRRGNSHAGLAQLVERVPCKHFVESSSLLPGSIWRVVITGSRAVLKTVGCKSLQGSNP